MLRLVRSGWIALAVLCCSGAIHAQQFVLDGFETPLITPVFPASGGAFIIPSGEPTADQLRWILSELQAGENTTAAEVQPRFIDAFNANDIADFINTLRTLWPDAFVSDIVALTPVSTTVVIDSANPGTNASGFLNLQTQFAGEGLVQFFSVSNYFGSVQFPDDQSLTLTQAVDELVTVAPATSVLVARIEDNQCVPIIDRNASTLRGTGSIFKIWVLGAIAEAVANGELSVLDAIPLVASALTPPGGSQINDEPLGTPFSVSELARLMLGISDNTATDLLHQVAGLTRLDDFVALSGVADSDVLQPLLSINQQFHLFYSFDLATSQGYLDATELIQRNFLQNQIVPLGPVDVFNAPFFHAELLDDGSWQASPLDICATFSQLRQTSRRNEAFELVNQALSAGIAQPEIRTAFDRVWFKGGSLSDASGFRVLSFAWLLENNGEDPYVVVAMLNRPDAGDIDQFVVQSLTSRIIQLLSLGT